MSRARAPHPPPHGIGFMISNIAVSAVQLGMSCFEMLIDTLELYPQHGAGNVDQVQEKSNDVQCRDDDYTTSSHPLHPRASDLDNTDQPIHIAQDSYEDASIKSAQPYIFPEQLDPINTVVARTEEERQAEAEEMANMFDFPQEIEAEDIEEDNVSELGDSTIREADTLIENVNNVQGFVVLRGEMERLQAENYILRNNLSAAGLLNRIAQNIAPDGNSISDSQSVQTRAIFSPITPLYTYDMI